MKVDRFVKALLTVIADCLLWMAFHAPDSVAWAQNRKAASDVLTVKGLIVVDEKGVERVRIGSPLPDPMQ